MAEEWELPEGWIIVKLRDIVSSGIKRNLNESEEDEFVYVDIDAIDNSKQKIVSPKRLSITDAPSRARMAIQAGDVIFSLVRPYLKNIAIVPEELNNQIASTAYCVMRPEAGILSSYIFYLVLRDYFINSIKTHGNSPPAAHDDEFLDMEVPLAPTNEQQRIVDAIEEEFLRLDAVETTLQSDMIKLKRSRKSLFKSASEGKLTKEWRARHPANESGDQWLEEILTKRQEQWEKEQLAKMEDEGLAPWYYKEGDYKEPLLVDTMNLPSLPDGWCWATVDQIGDVSEQVVLTGPFGSNLGKEDFIDSGVPVLTIGCLTEHGISLEKALYVSDEKADELNRYRVTPGDILFSRMASVGRADVVTPHLEGSIINYHLMRLRLASYAIHPAYFITYIRGAQTVADYIKEVNHGVTRNGINTLQLLALPVSVPPLTEQEHIVAEIERRISVIRQSEASLETNLKRVERIRQSLLKEAFAGRLVPQDQNDPPASELLEQIHEERNRRGQEDQERRRGDSMKVPRKPKTKKATKEPIPLHIVLMEAGKSLSPNELFRRSGLQADDIEDIDKFYNELREDLNKRIKTWRPDATQFLLEAKSE